MRSVIITFLAIAGTMLPIASSSCDASQAWTGCAVANTGTSIEIGATKRDSRPEHRLTSDESETAESSPSAPRDCGALNRCESQYTVSALPEVTIADLASFAPSPADLATEPAGYTVVGLPTAFLVTAAAHEATGTLFDLPVTVRFTPAAVSVSPGDGSSLTASASTGGAAAAGSHTYTARGTYTATASVDYAAEVDLGTGWRAVDGILSIPTTSHTITALEAHSTLVQHTCIENPSGPGC